MDGQLGTTSWLGVVAAGLAAPGLAWPGVLTLGFDELPLGPVSLLWSRIVCVCVYVNHVGFYPVAQSRL